MQNITKILSSAGIVMILGAVIRWGFVFYDLSQLILSIIIGVIFIGFGWIYEMIKLLDEDLSNLSKMETRIKNKVIKYISS